MDADEFHDKLPSLPPAVDVELGIIGTRLQIGHFTVDEQSRKNGIGKQTMQTIIDTARKTDIETIDVNIGYTRNNDRHPKTDPTTYFLEELGFTITEHTENTVTGIKRLRPEQNNEH